MTAAPSLAALPRLAAAALCGVLLVLTGCKEATLGPELYGSLQGQVLDAETGAPITGASVTTAPPSGALVTDGEGRFQIDEIPAGNYTITASRTGYRPNTVTVSVRENRITPAVLFLTESDSTDSGPTAAIDVQVLNWANRVRGDSNFVRIEYRVRNEGTVAIPNYEVYFRIATTGDTFFEERAGQNLGVGQSDIANFEKFIVTNTAVDVRVDTFYYEGQPFADPGRRVALRAPRRSAR